MGVIYVGSADAIMYKGNQRINKIYRGNTLAYNRTYSAPTINSISSDSTSITFTITNNADESATIVYEQGDATPESCPPKAQDPIRIEQNVPELFCPIPSEQLVSVYAPPTESVKFSSV